MREKVIAVCFLVFIFAISGQTVYNTMINEYMVPKTVLAEGDSTQSSSKQKEDDGAVTEVAMLEEEATVPPLMQLTEEELALIEQAQKSAQEGVKEVNTGELADGIVKSFSEKFTKNLAAKEEFVEVNTNASAVMSSQTYFQSTQVLLGKDNWLFYKRVDDGTSIPDYQGTGHYSEEKLRSIADNLMKQRDVLKAEGVRFVVFIVPNKEVMYFEYMPDTVYRESTTTRVDELVNYLRVNTDLEVVYPKNELMQAKTDQLVYYKYDTHWNDKGCFIGTQSLLKQLYGTHQDISEVTFNEVSGDLGETSGLAILAGVSDPFLERTKPKLSKDTLLEEQVVSDKILFAGDSFGVSLSAMCKNYFPNGSNNVGVWTFGMDTLERYKPDVVVWECVERYTERMYFMDITGEDNTIY